MSASSLTIPFSTNLIVDEYWVRLEQVEVDETATIGELAELVDAVFDINPCIAGTSTIGATEPVPVPVPVQPDSPDTLEQLAHLSEEVKRLFNLDVCNMDAECNYIAQIKVIISKPGGNYTLRLSNGVVVKTIIQEEIIDDHITIEKASGIVLDYPVIGDGIFEWGNSSIAQPEIVRTGSTLSWGEEVTGSIRVKYPTRYDLVDILVYSVKKIFDNSIVHMVYNVDPLSILEKNEEFEFGECPAIAFYHGSMDELTIVPPSDEGDDEDREAYCGPSGINVLFPAKVPKPQWVTIKTEWRCVCSDETSHYTYSSKYDEWDKKISNLLDAADAAKEAGDIELEAQLRAEAQSVANTHNKAPAQYIFPGIIKNIFGGYVDCEQIDNVSDADYYEELCCFPPTVTLPKCHTIYRKNPGGVPFEHEAEYKERYGENLRLIPRSPEDNDCGVTEYVQSVRALNCCDEVPPIIYDDVSSVDVIADNSQGTVYVDGGRPPFTVEVRGVGFFVDAGKTKITKSQADRSFHIYTGDACGVCKVIITDGCSTVEGQILSTTGTWVEIVNPVFDKVCVGGGEVSFISGGSGGSFQRVLSATKIIQHYGNKYPASCSSYHNWCAGIGGNEPWCITVTEMCAVLPTWTALGVGECVDSTAEFMAHQLDYVFEPDATPPEFNNTACFTNYYWEAFQWRC